MVNDRTASLPPFVGEPSVALREAHVLAPGQLDPRQDAFAPELPDVALRVPEPLRDLGRREEPSSVFVHTGDGAR